MTLRLIYGQHANFCRTDAAKFKSSDDDFTKRFESRQQLESYISRVEEIVSDPSMSLKLKRGNKEKIESALSDAMAQLEIEDSRRGPQEEGACPQAPDHQGHGYPLKGEMKIR